MLNKFNIVLFLATCIFFSGCSVFNNDISCKAKTKVLLKDFYTLNIGIEFFFNTKKEMRDFKIKKKEVLYALRLSLKQHKSSMLMKKGRNNVTNTIIAICKRRLNNKFSRIKITDYTFTKKNTESSPHKFNMVLIRHAREIYI